MDCIAGSQLNGSAPPCILEGDSQKLEDEFLKIRALEIVFARRGRAGSAIIQTNSVD